MNLQALDTLSVLYGIVIASIWWLAVCIMILTRE